MSGMPLFGAKQNWYGFDTMIRILISDGLLDNMKVLFELF